MSNRRPLALLIGCHPHDDEPIPAVTGSGATGEPSPADELDWRHSGRNRLDAALDIPHIVGNVHIAPLA